MNRSTQRLRPNRSRDRDSLRRAGTLASVILAGLALLSAPASAADNPTPQKILRQIGVMEKIIDKVLVDSPNVLVSGMGNTRGLYVDPYGVVFTFTASILRGDSPMASFSDVWKFNMLKDQYDITTDEDGNQVITIKKQGKKDKADKDDSEGATASATAKGDSDVTSWQSERAKKYEAAKAELVQAILDYGETMTSLKPGQCVLIAGFMKDDDFFKEEKISRFVLKAKVDDLRGFAAGDLTESAMRSKIQIEEY